MFNLYQPYLIDPVAMALTAWCITAVAYNWTKVLPLLLTAAGLARETTTMLIVPLYLVLRRRWVDVGTGVQVSLLIGLALLAMWAVRQPQRSRQRKSSRRPKSISRPTSIRRPFRRSRQHMTCPAGHQRVRRALREFASARR
ncbi:hypothetical protein [Virgisporangium aurantiacum]|uniref:Uncharacterized protein n=1 Tax=Virgisporangium aurantiacum TaxID=175570 RepID=A0A8J3ZEB2_9ACTN|nr:hypothetical protein [Virgisporangium aurantiacum]GIJ60036.1 hypothetical protein Vau01_075520 [Virgisporangium aurantiacum]